ncbi:MAG: DUF1217 domain-containing protein [Gluconacetobacter diazotrophicus]|nr:DUF1217 domain-containing protein [Gluconacetobacter diazotrophicus]
MVTVISHLLRDLLSLLRCTAQATSAKGSTTLVLGAAGAALLPGQNIAQNGETIGTVGRVAADGTVTLLSGSAAAVSAGASLQVLPAVSGGTTPALSDAANVAGIVRDYEYASYETRMGRQYPGMDDALYFTRSMGAVSSITQLMSNPRLLSVVTTSLGMNSYFGALDYDQQIRLLTAKVNLKTLNTPAGLQRTAEQFLISKSQAAAGGAPTGLAALFSGRAASPQSLLAAINGAGTLGDATTTPRDPALALFA